jgi:predicted nucleic acid-binding protein
VAADEPPVVVDTNIIFSALLSADSRFREILFTSTRRFVICETTIVDLFRLQDKLRKLRPNRPQNVLDSMLHSLLRRLELMREDTLSKETWDMAAKLCSRVDVDDTAQVALALAADGLLWTGDERLKRALREQGFAKFFTPPVQEEPGGTR